MKESGSAQVQSVHARESKEIGGGKGGRGAAQTALMAREAEVRTANKASEELKSTQTASNIRYSSNSAS